MNNGRLASFMKSKSNFGGNFLQGCEVDYGEIWMLSKYEKRIL
jgi:hypothetical protein